MPVQQPLADKTGPPARSGSPAAARDRGGADLLPEDDDDSDEDDTPLSSASRSSAAHSEKRGENGCSPGTVRAQTRYGGR